MAENNKTEQKETALERFGLWLAAWSEKWFPDAWVFALVGIVFVFVIRSSHRGESPEAGLAKEASPSGFSFPSPCRWH